jgi:hypothetical protein
VDWADLTQPKTLERISALGVSEAEAQVDQLRERTLDQLPLPLYEFIHRRSQTLPPSSYGRP